MNEETPSLGFEADLAMWSLGLFLFFVGLLICVFVGVVLVRARHRAASPQPVSARSPSLLSLFARFQFAREFAWLAVPFVVIASFGMMTDPREFWWAWRLPTRAVAPLSSPSRPTGVRVESDHVPVSTVSTSGTSARPAWVDQPRLVDGDCERITLTGHQFSTREEAEQELRVAAVKLVEEDLRRLQTGPFHPKSWRPAAEDVIAHAVKERYDDVAEHDFGSFTHPMHRASWLVELSPAVRTEFMPAWRRAVISFRILFVAAVASLLAMAASASVMYFRLDSQTQGRARGPLKLLTGGLTAGWWALVAISFSQGHWW
ncbi:MAG: hypothetical protein AABP62_29665 [Planctomycetota bacterium]